MDIEIRKLTPELAADYFDFFENRAFTDNSPYLCYCQPYQMTKDEAKEAFGKADGTDIGRVSRELAKQQIDSGALQGYLAFLNGVVIGWCNANARANFPLESSNGVRFYAPPELREKAAVCFEIAPEFRGKGVATTLLQQVVTDAAVDGYIAVEGFPIIRTERYEWDCRGPVRLFEKTEFVKVSEQDDFAVMRREL